jgi:ubiquinone/menaquinone biosynthesis C-methylase UbiE
MNNAAEASKLNSGVKSRLSALGFVLSEPVLRKAVARALWRSTPFAAGIPRVAGTARQKHNRSRRWSFLQKLSYEVMSDLNQDRSMTFINLGYAGLDAPHTTTLPPENESNRYAIQLYDSLFRFADAKGKDVLEVGCGRGGGANFIYKSRQPGSYLAIDFAKAHIEYCNRVHSEPGLQFQVGRAESLDVPDCSKDIIVNVESSHCYTSPGLFFKEVHRILKPGGMFLFTDIRGEGVAGSYQTVSMLEDQFSALEDMRLIDRINITKNVMRALELAGESEVRKWTQNMRENLSRSAKSEWFLETFFEPNARKSFSTDVPESTFSWYSYFKEGKAEYWSYVFQKTE